MVYLLTLCISSFVNYLFKYFIHFPLDYCSSCYWIVRILFSFGKKPKSFFISIYYEYFIPVYGLPFHFFKYWHSKSFPGDNVVKNPPANSGGTRDPGSILGSRRSPGVGNGNSLQYSCWEISWTVESGGLQILGLQRVRHDWALTQKAGGFHFNEIDFIIFLNAFDFLHLSRECLISLRLQVFYSKFSCRVFIVVLLKKSLSIFYFDLILCVLWGKGRDFFVFCFALLWFISWRPILLTPSSSSSCASFFFSSSFFFGV